MIVTHVMRRGWVDAYRFHRILKQSIADEASNVLIVLEHAAAAQPRVQEEDLTKLYNVVTVTVKETAAGLYRRGR